MAFNKDRESDVVWTTVLSAGKQALFEFFPNLISSGSSNWSLETAMCPYMINEFFFLKVVQSVCQVNLFHF